MDGKPKQRLQVDDWPRIIQQWLYPPTCLLCDAPGTQGWDLCAGCKNDLPYARHACPRCASPLPAAAAPDSTCGRCQKKPPRFDAVIALCHYQEPIRHLLHAFKFQHRHACARLLGDLLAERLATLTEKPQLIIPVPLHPQRYSERGFNQALELGRPLSRQLHIPLGTHYCRRIRATIPQTELNIELRRRNLRGAFQVTEKPPADHVALLDDIVTTGATAGELTRVLKRAGVARVDVWCCAKA
ncbi:MAG: ComF family protein [Methylococcaceae bacterium]|nr:MAG: ComF family protein [Methylococcaceae bacterium]